MAIHDAVYATPPATWSQFWHRMQHIAEEGLGHDIRASQQREDAAFNALNQ